MNIKTKKITFGVLAAVTAIAVPIATVVSCGNKKDAAKGSQSTGGNGGVTGKGSKAKQNLGPKTIWDAQKNTINISPNLFKQFRNKPLIEFYDELAKVFDKALADKPKEKSFSIVTFEENGKRTQAYVKRDYLKGFKKVKANIVVTLEYQANRVAQKSYGYYPTLLQENSQELSRRKQFDNEEAARENKTENPDFSFADSAFYYMRDALYGSFNRAILQTAKLKAVNKSQGQAGNSLGAMIASLTQSGTREIMASAFGDNIDKIDAMGAGTKGYIKQYKKASRKQGHMALFYEDAVKKYGLKLLKKLGIEEGTGRYVGDKPYAVRTVKKYGRDFKEKLPFEAQHINLMGDYAANNGLVGKEGFIFTRETFGGIYNVAANLKLKLRDAGKNATNDKEKSKLMELNPSIVTDSIVEVDKKTTTLDDTNGFSVWDNKKKSFTLDFRKIGKTKITSYHDFIEQAFTNVSIEDGDMGGTYKWKYLNRNIKYFAWYGRRSLHPSLMKVILEEGSIDFNIITKEGKKLTQKLWWDDISWLFYNSVRTRNNRLLENMKTPLDKGTMSSWPLYYSYKSGLVKKSGEKIEDTFGRLIDALFSCTQNSTHDGKSWSIDANVVHHGMDLARAFGRDSKGRKIVGGTHNSSISHKMGTQILIELFKANKLADNEMAIDKFGFKKMMKIQP